MATSTLLALASRSRPQRRRVRSCTRRAPKGIGGVEPLDGFEQLPQLPPEHVANSAKHVEGRPWVFASLDLLEHGEVEPAGLRELLAAQSPLLAKPLDVPAEICDQVLFLTLRLHSLTHHERV